MNRNYKAYVFDVYGTLLDFNSAVAGLAEQIGPKASQLSIIWRQKQLEYSWLRTLMGRHTDFDGITREALDYAINSLDLGELSLQEVLLDLFKGLRPFPEAPEAIVSIKSLGISTAVLSNGSYQTLQDSLQTSGLYHMFDRIYSIDTVGKFKPHPAVYQIASEGLDLEPSNIVFVSANGWDIAGAASFGFNTIWVNRSGSIPENLPCTAQAEVSDLSDLLNVSRK